MSRVEKGGSSSQEGSTCHPRLLCRHLSHHVCRAARQLQHEPGGLVPLAMVFLYAAEKAREAHALRQSLRDTPSSLCCLDPWAERQAFGNDMAAARKN